MNVSCPQSHSLKTLVFTGRNSLPQNGSLENRDSYQDPSLSKNIIEIDFPFWIEAKLECQLFAIDFYLAATFDE